MTTLIMSENRPQQIADGIKKLTVRPKKDGDRLVPHSRTGSGFAVTDGKGYTRWQVEKLYGIKPKRTHPVCLVDRQGKVVTDYHDILYTLTLYDDIVYELTMKQARDVMLNANNEYRLLRVKLLDIKAYDVRQMNGAEAAAEGFGGPDGDGVVGYWEWWCKTYDPVVLKDKAVIEHHAAYNAGHCSWEQYYVLLEGRVFNRPDKLYEGWQLQFERYLNGDG